MGDAACAVFAGDPRVLGREGEAMPLIAEGVPEAEQQSRTGAARRVSGREPWRLRERRPRCARGVSYRCLRYVL
jgi:hypothetical protein